MKCIVAGTRHLPIQSSDEFDNIMYQLIKRTIKPTQILSGRGGTIDLFGESYGKRNDIEVKYFPAEWDRHGKAAGPIRNQVMVDEADMLFLIWDGESRGSHDVLRKARKKGIPVQQVVMKNGNDKRSVSWRFEEI